MPFRRLRVNGLKKTWHGSMREEELNDLLHMGNHITNTKKLESYKDRLTELEEAQEGFQIFMGGTQTGPTGC